jgi:urease accessory protein
MRKANEKQRGRGRRVIFLVGALLLPSLVWAHPGHGEAGVLGGLSHPFSGLDHVLGMLAMGIWAARNNGWGRWLVPAAFLGGMMGGALLGFGGLVPPHLESAVTATVVASVLMATLAARLPLAAKAAMAAIFALSHGLAHGAEIPVLSSPGAYAAGFLAATALLLSLGVGLGLVAQQTRREGWLGAALATLTLSLFWV